MAVQLIDICKSYGDNQVLDRVSLTFPAGEVTCIMGASGIGKTTLVGIIAGLVQADSGEVRGISGKKVSLVFQEDRLLEWETALSNVLFVTKHARKHQERARDLLTRAGLGDSLNKRASELSGGMKRRVCLCRALIAEYDILLLDEPFKGLDNKLKPVIMDLVLDEFKSAEGKTLICITHDPSEAEYLGGGDMVRL